MNSVTIITGLPKGQKEETKREVRNIVEKRERERRSERKMLNFFHRQIRKDTAENQEEAGAFVSYI